MQNTESAVGRSRIIEDFFQLLKITIDFRVYDLFLECPRGVQVVAVVNVEAAGLVAVTIEGAAPEDGFRDAAEAGF